MSNLSFCPRNKPLQIILAEAVEKSQNSLHGVIIHHVTAVSMRELQFEYEAKDDNGGIIFGRLWISFDGD
jgi:hypothetical protein